MLGVVPGLIEDYCKAHTMNEPELLKELSKETIENTKLPQMFVGHVQGVFLRVLLKAIKAKRVLEIGTFTGYSALAMAGSLPDDGELVTCNIEAETNSIAQKYFDKSPDGKKIKLKIGKALETLKTLEGEFDLIFIDADKANYVNYWKACVPLVKQGGLIIVDNVLWYGRVLDPEKESDFAISEFNETAVNDSKTEVVMLSVRDGITMAIKK